MKRRNNNLQSNSIESAAATGAKWGAGVGAVLGILAGVAVGAEMARVSAKFEKQANAGLEDFRGHLNQLRVKYVEELEKESQAKWGAIYDNLNQKSQPTRWVVEGEVIE